MIGWFIGTFTWRRTWLTHFFLQPLVVEIPILILERNLSELARQRHLVSNMKWQRHHMSWRWLGFLFSFFTCAQYNSKVVEVYFFSSAMNHFSSFPIVHIALRFCTASLFIFMLSIRQADRRTETLSSKEIFLRCFLPTSVVCCIDIFASHHVNDGTHSIPAIKAINWKIEKGKVEIHWRTDIENDDDNFSYFIDRNQSC